MLHAFAFQFTFKVTVNDNDDTILKDAAVRITLVGSDYDATSMTGDDGTTTNNDKKFEFGSKVTMTVTKTGYFAKKEVHEFKDSDATEQEYTIKLTKEGNNC